MLGVCVGARTHISIYTTTAGFTRGSVLKNRPANSGDKGDTGLIPGLGRSPGGGNGKPLQWAVFLPQKPNGERSLVGYSPWGSKELDMISQLNNSNDNASCFCWKDGS